MQSARAACCDCAGRFFKINTLHVGGEILFWLPFDALFLVLIWLSVSSVIRWFQCAVINFRANHRE